MVAVVVVVVVAAVVVAVVTLLMTSSEVVETLGVEVGLLPVAWVVGGWLGEGEERQCPGQSERETGHRSPPQCTRPSPGLNHTLARKDDVS